MSTLSSHSEESGTVLSRVLWHGSSVALSTGDRLLPERGIRTPGRVCATEHLALAIFFACLTHRGLGVVECTSGTVEYVDEITRFSDGYVYMVDSSNFKPDPQHPGSYFAVEPVRVVTKASVSKNHVRFQLRDSPNRSGFSISS